MSQSTVPGVDLDRFYDLLREVEAERKTRIWSILHDGHAHICSPTIRAVFQGRTEIGTGEKIELLVHSGGGHPEIAYRVMKFFRRRFKIVNIIVPLYAKSSATLMCLAANNIYIGEFADLGPIDIQISDQVKHGQQSFSPLDEFKSLEFLRDQTLEWMDYYATLMNVQYGLSIKEALKDSIPLVSAVMRPIFEQIDPIEMGGYRRAIAIGEEYAKRMLAMTGNPNSREIIRRTVWDYPSHDFCIDFEELRELGLPVQWLPEEQDRKLSAAITALQREALYGFAPSLQPATASPKPPPPSKRLPKTRSAKRSGLNGRVNGSGGKGQEERIRP